MKVKIKDVKVGDLNNVCIMLISKFARVLKEHNGTIIQLRDKNVMQQVVFYAEQASNPQLEVLYLRLKLEVKDYLNKPSIRNGGFDKIVVKANLKKRIQTNRRDDGS